MLRIHKNRVVIEADNNDLWQLATMLRDGMLCKAKYVLAPRYGKNLTEQQFIDRVLQDMHPQYRYIGEIYYEIGRNDKMDELNTEIEKIYREFIEVGGSGGSTSPKASVPTEFAQGDSPEAANDLGS